MIKPLNKKTIGQVKFETNSIIISDLEQNVFEMDNLMPGSYNCYAFYQDKDLIALNLIRRSTRQLPYYGIVSYKNIGEININNNLIGVAANNNFDIITDIDSNGILFKTKDNRGTIIETKAKQAKIKVIESKIKDTMQVTAMVLEFKQRSDLL